MVKQRRFIQCDVFSSQPTKGNGLAVVLDGEGLSDAQMQEFAAWTNLAETTFLLPPVDPEADYKVRIFTTVREMLFAGHPTLGSCFSWLHAGGSPKQSGMVMQECGVGLVPIHTDGKLPAFEAPPTAVEPLPEADVHSICEALDVPAASVVQTTKLNNGPVWQVLELESADAVLAVDAGRVRWPEFKSIGLIGPHPVGSECDYEVRMLAPSSGMKEDPITGSLNAALAQWLAGQGRLKNSLTVAQGTQIGRVGRVHIRPAGGKILVGGQTTLLIEGTVTL